MNMVPEVLSIHLFGGPPAVEDFPASFAHHFREQLRLLAWDDQGAIWSLKCELAKSDAATIAAIKDYLQLRFESGELEFGGAAFDLFEVLPGVFFVSNMTDQIDGQIEVQLIDRFGRAKDSRVVTEEREMIIGQTVVPKTVIAAGRRLTPGTGDFLDSDGKQVLPCDFEKFRVA